MTTTIAAATSMSTGCFPTERVSNPISARWQPLLLLDWDVRRFVACGDILQRLAHNVRSQQEVDEVIEQARTNGAEITREPADTFYGGYAGAFRDPDGHAWEIAHNPASVWTTTGTSSFPALERLRRRYSASA